MKKMQIGVSNPSLCIIREIIVKIALRRDFIMEKLCPICNAIVTPHIKCSLCGKEMKDIGRTHEYSDPYGSEHEIYFKNGCCEHYFVCENCNNNKNISIKDVYI